MFFALQFQPEVTSVPMTRPWFNTDQLIIYISSYLPDGWKLVVKEHPNMYADKIGSLVNYRMKTIYEVINGLKNVILAPFNLKSNVLLNYSHAVIAGTGSIGTEALTANKPVLALGNAPYVGISNVYTAKSFSDLSSLLSKLDSICSVSDHSFASTREQLAKLSLLPPNSDLEILSAIHDNEEPWQIPYSSSFNEKII